MTAHTTTPQIESFYLKLPRRCHPSPSLFFLHTTSRTLHSPATRNYKKEEWRSLSRLLAQWTRLIPPVLVIIVLLPIILAMSTPRPESRERRASSKRQPHQSRDEQERPRSHRPPNSRRSSRYSTHPPPVIETTATIDGSVPSPVSDEYSPPAHFAKQAAISRGPSAPSILDDEDFEKQERARRRAERAERRAERERQREQRARRRKERELKKAERAWTHDEREPRQDAAGKQARHAQSRAGGRERAPSSSRTIDSKRLPLPRRNTEQTWSAESSTLDYSDEKDSSLTHSSVDGVRMPASAHLSSTIVDSENLLSKLDDAGDERRSHGRKLESRHGADSRAPSPGRKRDRRPRCDSRQYSESFSSLYIDDEKRPSKTSRGRQHSRHSSAYGELDYYKNHRVPSLEDPERYTRRGCCGCGGRWSRRRKWVVLGSIFTLILIIILVAVGVSVAKKGYGYTPSTVKVTNAAAFAAGGATHNSTNDVKDGIGAGEDAYTYYSGKADEFPPSSHWVSFDSMWANNLNTIQNACGWLDAGANNSPEVIQDIYNAIQDRANASLVDHRFILAVIMQESHGCVRVDKTVSSGGVHNPGLMQSHNGHSYSASHSQKSILAMVQDGTQGTKDGPGLAQLLDTYGNPYMAARGYNSGYIPKSGNLSEAAGATACYVSDIANRLTGWVKAETKCPGNNDR